MTGSLTWGALRPIAIRFAFLAIVAIALVGVLVAIPNSASAATTVTVNSTGDLSDADLGINATCETVLGNGVCTLRAAIETANGGFADTILFALPGGSGTINLGAAALPFIKVDLAIDASGNTVIIDGTGVVGGASGFEVLASLPGQNFSLVSGTGDLTIRDITGTSTDKIFGHAAVKVCGRTACAGGAADINLGTILVDDITITGVTGARGVHIVANNLSDATVSNSFIRSSADGVMLKATGTSPAVPPLATDNAMAVTGSDIESTGDDAVDMEVCTIGDVACDLASKISITIDGNTNLEGDTVGNGVEVDVDIDEATAGSSINVTVDDNTGGIRGYHGVKIDLDFDDPDTGDLSASVSVSRTQGAIVGAGDEGIELEVDIAGADLSPAPTHNHSTILIDDNVGGITGEHEAVEVDSNVSAGDHNSNTVSASRNGNISSVQDEAVDFDLDAKDGNNNTNTANIDDNGMLTNATAGDQGVVVRSFAGGASNNNVSIVKINGNDGIVATGDAVDVGNFAGSDAIGASAADGNTADTEVNNNGDIKGDRDGSGAGNGIAILNQAGSLGTACACGGDNNKSLVDASNNGDVEGGDDAIDIESEAGAREDGALNNSSDVSLNLNGHIKGDTNGDGTGNGVHVESRAGTEDADGSAGNGNSSTVTLTGTGAHDISGGNKAVDITSEAGAEMGGDGNNNSSDVSVTGMQDIFTFATASDDDAVRILSQAGAFGGVGDNNHATSDVSANRKITSLAGDAIEMDVLAGGSAAASGATTNSTDASVTSNTGDITAGGGEAVDIGLLVCCVSSNTNSVDISQNQDLIGSLNGIFITGEDTPSAGFFPAGVCCSTNTFNITDNAGVITGTAGDGLHVNVFGVGQLGPNSPSLTNLTVSGNTIANSGTRGIEVENMVGVPSDLGADFSGSVISGNTVRDNTGAGIFLDSVSGATIGPDNIIDDNAGATGLHIEESTGEADRNTITQNSMFENGLLGIDLDDDNPPTLDSPDGVGCKNAQAPSASVSVTADDDPNTCIQPPNGVSSIDKLLTGAACADCRVEIFVANAVLDDQTGPGDIQYGEGETYLGFVTASGAGAWTYTIPCGLGGESLTMTATGKFGNTSEFGPNFGPLPANSCDTPTPTDTDTPTPTNTPGGPTNTPTNTPTPVDTAEFTLCKDTNPESSGKSFDFDTDIRGFSDPDLEDDECATRRGVDPDDYEITENPPAGWELDDVDCDGIPGSRWDVDLDARLLEIELRAGDDVECTFTNVDVDPMTSSISITKETDPSGSTQEFDFESDVTGLDDFDVADGETEEATDLAAGTYEIIELDVDGWNLIEIDCTGTDDANIDVDLNDNTVTVELEEGEDVECSFTNEQKPTPTATPMSPTDTPTPTDTPVPPTSTNTPVPPTSTATNTPVIPATPGNTIGDVNKNGVVNAIDAQLIKQAEAGFITLANPKNADVNLDGEVNSVDALLIQQFVAGLIPSLPV